jgi:hypothetical protein
MRNNDRKTERREKDEITRLQAVIDSPCATSEERCIALRDLELYEELILKANVKGWS